MEGLDSMKFFNVKGKDEVNLILREFAENYKLSTESVDINYARGRIVAEAVMADSDVPAFDRSTVDGYAIRSIDSHGSSESIPSLVTLKGLITIGKEVNDIICIGEAVYIPTGGMMPAGADCVIMIEDTEQLDERTICLNKSVAIGDNVVYKGNDIYFNQTVLERGKKLSTMDIGVLAALGVSKVNVFKKPVVSIISTGDEIIDISEDMAFGKIYDINGYVLQNLVSESGGVVIQRRIIKDDYKSLYDAVDQATALSDIVLLSGGSSVGTRDFTYEVIKNLKESKVFVQGISIKPGKPTIIGCGKGKLVVGLPGHPVSAVLVYKVFIDYYIRQLRGECNKEFDFEGQLSENVHSSPGKTTYLMVEICINEGKFNIIPKYGKSGMISLLSKSRGYIVIEPHQEGLKAGESVRGYYL